MLEKNTNKDVWIIGFAQAFREKEIKTVDIEYNNENNAFKFSAFARLFDGSFVFLIGGDKRDDFESELNKILNQQ